MLLKDSRPSSQCEEGIVESHYTATKALEYILALLPLHECRMVTCWLCSHLYLALSVDVPRLSTF